VDEVVAGAGVAKGTFYLYFPSKEHLLAALRERFLHQLMRRQRSAVDELPQQDWAGRLDAWVSEMVGFYVANAHLHHVLFPGSRLEVRDQSVEAATDQHVAALTALLDEGTRAGRFHLVDPRATAVLLYGAIQGAVDHLLHHDGALPTHLVLAELRRLCRRVVVGFG